MAHKEQLELVVNSFRIFRPISKMRQSQFTSVCQVNRFKPGHRIVRRNDRQHVPRFYVITSGVARVSQKGFKYITHLMLLHVAPIGILGRRRCTRS